MCTIIKNDYMLIIAQITTQIINNKKGGKNDNSVKKPRH